MSKRALLLIVMVLTALGEQPFSLQIASSIAGQGPHLKSSSFVFRSLGCPDPSKVEVTAKAEGRVRAQRRTVPLRLVPSPAPGAFAIFREWPTEGVWVISLAAKCGARTAGALVAPGASGPDRERSKFLSRAPSEADIEAALK